MSDEAQPSPDELQRRRIEEILAQYPEPIMAVVPGLKLPKEKVWPFDPPGRYRR